LDLVEKVGAGSGREPAVSLNVRGTELRRIATVPKSVVGGVSAGATGSPVPFSADVSVSALPPIVRTPCRVPSAIGLKVTFR
jgi:hypothetical protein